MIISLWGAFCLGSFCPVPKISMKENESLLCTSNMFAITHYVNKNKNRHQCWCNG